MSIQTAPSDRAKPRVLLVVLALLAGVAALVGLKVRYGGLSRLAFTQFVTFDPKTWAWRNEEHWAVDQTVRDLGEMMVVAAGDRPEQYRFRVEPAPTGAHAYEVRVEGPRLAKALEHRLQLRQSLWDPADFKGLSSELRAALRLAAPSPDPGMEAEVMQALLSPNAIDLERIQQRVSKALNAAPASREVHEEAGAVLVTFGLFDDAGVFQDHRHILCRLTAHLALAAEYGPGPAGPAGRVSQVGLLILTGRTAAAMEALAQMKQDAKVPLPAPWTNVLTMRATGDWRGVTDPAKATEAEVLASFAGRGESQSPDEAYDWAQSALPWGSHEFLHHIAFHWQPGVSMGHLLTATALPTDLKRIEEVRQERHEAPTPSRRAWTEAMNAHPGRAYNASTHALEVLDWGQWAHRYQLALMDDMIRAVDFNSKSFGSKSDTERYLDRIEREYDGLEQFPILQKRYSYARSSAYMPGILGAGELARRHPELVSDGNFVRISKGGPWGAPPPAMPRYGQWLGLPVPFGTGYNLSQRCWEMDEWGRQPLAVRKQFRVQNPYDQWLPKDCLQAQFGPKKPTPEVIEELYGPIKAFAPKLYFGWMTYSLAEGSPEELAMLKQYAEVDPSRYAAYGRALARKGRDEEALQAYLAFHELTHDRVQVANGMMWTVGYLYKHGQEAKAEALAHECAEAYSATGLHTLAYLRELQGRYKEAEVEYDKIVERYGGESEVLGMYLRCADRDPGMKAKLEKTTKRLFPAGMKKFDLAKETAPPAVGVTLASYPTWTLAKGLRAGAIIVAIDGFKVENQAQYIAVRSGGLDDDLHLVVFQDGKYLAMDLSAPNRRFGVDLVDYVGR